MRTVSIKADIDILPNMQKTADSLSALRGVIEGIKIGAGWTRKDDTSNKGWIVMSIAAPEFGPKKLYAILGKTAGSDDKDLRSVIWNPTDLYATRARAAVWGLGGYGQYIKEPAN